MKLTKRFLRQIQDAAKGELEFSKTRRAGGNGMNTRRTLKKSELDLLFVVSAAWLPALSIQLPEARASQAPAPEFW